MNDRWSSGITTNIDHAAQHSVHVIPGKLRRGHGGGTRPVFRQFLWLKPNSVKVAFSRPAHQRVTHTVGRSMAHQKST